SYQSAAHHFAVATPKEWVNLNTENSDNVLKQYTDRLPEAVHNLDFSKVVAYFYKVDDTRIGGASMNVVAVQGHLPRLTEGNKAEVTQVATESLKSLAPNYALESSELVDVDNLHAIRIIGKASLHMMVQPEVTKQVRDYGSFFHTERVSAPVYSDIEQRI